MKKNSPTRLAEQCRAKLHDRNWDQLLAGRVMAARRRQARTRAALGIVVLVFSAFTVLGTAAWSEEQQWAALFDEAPYAVSWSIFTE